MPIRKIRNASVWPCVHVCMLMCVCVYVEGSQDLIFSIIIYSEGHLYFI